MLDMPETTEKSVHVEAVLFTHVLDPEANLFALSLSNKPIQNLPETWSHISIPFISLISIALLLPHTLM